jgi:hypothetical protein
MTAFVNQRSFRLDQSLHQPRVGYVCWTRMQAEAGQPLAAILQRKELERRAGRGIFFWGVGNAPSRLCRPLARTGVPVPVVFSVMKSAPKKIDESPTGLLVWNGYVDSEGVERPIPHHVLVTSRSMTGSGPKTVHYALICHSDVPLQLGNDPFDHRQFRNAGTGGAIGASQVTALLEPALDAPTTTPEYRQNLVAQLTDSYWVRLTRPAPIKEAELSAVLDNVSEYRRAVANGYQRVGGLPAACMLV